MLLESVYKVRSQVLPPLVPLLLDLGIYEPVSVSVYTIVTHHNSPSMFLLGKWDSVIHVVLQFACFPFMFLGHYFVSLPIPKLHFSCLHNAIPSIGMLQLFTEKLLFFQVISIEIHLSFTAIVLSGPTYSFLVLTNAFGSIPRNPSLFQDFRGNVLSYWWVLW